MCQLNNLADGLQGQVSLETFYPISHRVVVEVAEGADHEVVSGRVAPLETEFLDNIRVIFNNQRFCMKVGETTSVVVTVLQANEDSSAGFGWIDDNAEIEVRTPHGPMPTVDKSTLFHIRFSSCLNIDSQSTPFFELNNLACLDQTPPADTVLIQVITKDSPFCPLFIPKLLFSPLEVLPFCPALISLRFQRIETQKIPTVGVTFPLLISNLPKNQTSFTFFGVNEMKVRVLSAKCSSTEISVFLKKEFDAFAQRTFNGPLLLPLNVCMSTKEHFSIEFVTAEVISQSYWKIDNLTDDILSQINSHFDNLDNLVVESMVPNHWSPPFSWDISNETLSQFHARLTCLDKSGLRDFVPITIHGPTQSGKSVMSMIAPLLFNQTTLRIDLKRILLGDGKEWDKVYLSIQESMKECLAYPSLTLILDGTDKLTIQSQSDTSKGPKSKVSAFFER